ncbi:translation elongation factor Ts (EF-Ts) [Limimonas halophila]|uniref:Elongation factor Ts n=1 Tax=Limimonas halophila TaxID=1082479 RepID=A0A1G7N968_9PROT|nr:translation elongation factor Ts [Limimonas halophila]SDF70471.1 translation elongation factor Ts (EF-Ts) [Limimonas halophila]
MADVSAALVKQLRERTGAGMMDCKKALADTEGDIEAAVDWLRQKGLSQAAKKAGRTAADGLIGVHTAGTSGAIVEVNAETDFVARNETFQDFVGKVTELALSAGGDLETLKQTIYPETGRTVEEELTQTIATIGENMKLSRSAALSVDRGAVSAYVHNQLAPNLGKIGVLVALEADVESEKLEGLAKQLAMHVAAAQPNAVSQADIDPAVVERERRVLEQQARDSGKPENIIEKMVEGRLRKFYEEIALLDQLFVVDGESRVRDVIKKASDDLGTEVKVAGFVRFSLGEGAESESEEESAASA